MQTNQTLKEVRELLDGESTLPEKLVQRLTLSLLADMSEALQEAQDKEDVRHAKIDEDLSLLKKVTIVLWIKNNKPIASALVILSFLVVVFLQDVLRPIIAKALGLP